MKTDIKLLVLFQQNKFAQFINGAMVWIDMMFCHE